MIRKKRLLIPSPRQDKTFHIEINDPLSNSFVGPPPSVAARLAVEAEKTSSSKPYDSYVDPGLEVRNGGCSSNRRQLRHHC